MVLAFLVVLLIVNCAKLPIPAQIVLVAILNIVELAISAASVTARYVKQQVHVLYVKVDLLYTIITVYLVVWLIVINAKVPAHAVSAKVDIP